MKTLIATLALCLGTAAFAQDNPQQQQQKPPEAPSAGQLEGPTLFEADELNAQRRLEEAQGGAGTQQEQAVFKKGAQSFELRGNLGESSNESITIQRANLPSVKLDVKEQTVVMLDGQQVKPDQLPPGANVRAQFQVSNEDILAVRVEASSQGQKQQRQPATGGAGQQGGSEQHPHGGAGYEDPDVKK